MIRKLIKTDNLMQVAQIIYQTDDFIFPFLFGKKEKAIPRLKQLVELEHNAFSYQHIIIDIETEIKGILIEQNRSDNIKEERDYKQVFSTLSLILLAIKQVFLFPIFHFKLKEGRYIQNLTVDEKSRGQGIGTRLLLDALMRAKEDGIKKLYLDVEIKNHKAIKLYEKHGFVIKKKKRIWYLFPATYWMEKII